MLRIPAPWWSISCSVVARLSRCSWFSSTNTCSDLHNRHSKVVSSAKEALQDVPNLKGITVAVGGFGLGGNPQTLINELSKDPRASDLTVASLTAGVDGDGVGVLLEADKVKRIVSSYVGENKYLETMYFAGKLQVELTPQGTIAQRMYAAGAGIPAFFTPTGAGTIYAKGGIPIKYKEAAAAAAARSPREVEIASPPRVVQEFDGREYVMERALASELALIKAWKADTRGNLIFRGTARNSNPDAGM